MYITLTSYDDKIERRVRSQCSFDSPHTIQYNNNMYVIHWPLLVL